METTRTTLQVGTQSKVHALSLSWKPFALVGMMLLAAFTRLYNLAQNGYGNEYYAAAVRSMLSNWHSFYFASFDAGGFVTVDKPPLGLWIQAAFAWALGFNSWSVLLPSAIAGIASVALIYHLVQRTFGIVAGLIAGVALALTPISVAIDRDNNLDGLLVFVSLLALWAGLVAAERASLRLLLLSLAMVGLGFNIKMGEALFVAPGLYLLYFLGARIPWHKRIVHLALTTVVLVAVSLSWAVSVQLTPPDQRPYIGSTQTNNIFDLITGYNGLQRVEGSNFEGVGFGQVNPRGGGFGGRGFSAGSPGVLRLFNDSLAGQISWLLPLAILGLVAAAWQTRLRWRLDRRHQSLVAYAGWLGPGGFVLSMMSGLFHPYYTVMIAPPIAALVGAGVISLWRDYRRHTWRSWLLPAALLITAGCQVVFLNYYPQWSLWISPVLVILCIVGAGGLILARLWRPFSGNAWTKLAVGAAMFGLLVGPAAYSASSILTPGNGTLPQADPQALSTGNGGQGLPGAPGGFGGGFGGFGGGPGISSDILTYLEQNSQGEKFILAVPSAMAAAPTIILTGQPVMAMGGFSGSDPILNANSVQQLVAKHVVRFFMLSGGFGGPGGAGRPGNNGATSWVQNNCTALPNANGIYDCGAGQ